MSAEPPNIPYDLWAKEVNARRGELDSNAVTRLELEQKFKMSTTSVKLMLKALDKEGRLKRVTTIRKNKRDISVPVPGYVILPKKDEDGAK